jgi:hypothetical protein
MELAPHPEDVKGRQFAAAGLRHAATGGLQGPHGPLRDHEIDDDARDLVMKEASTSRAARHARKRGMRTLRECGLLSIFEGQTTIDEVVRETIMPRNDDARCARGGVTRGVVRNRGGMVADRIAQRRAGSVLEFEAWRPSHTRH